VGHAVGLYRAVLEGLGVDRACRAMTRRANDDVSCHSQADFSDQRLLIFCHHRLRGNLSMEV
jgi:hypothetical protein